mgnify:CR=1 FL=1|tara:strand:- start:3488 stop:4966 length:1479 start_codon:yes stop_codon:yes gene_type:complete
MATEPLIVLLDAKTQKLDAKLAATDRRLDKLDDSVKKTDTSFAQMGKAAVFGATIAAAAITTMTNAAVNFAKELEVAARRANTTVEEMQALAFASGTVGISLEKLGDISKDTNEKIGEFIATGGGGFVDFIDVMKMSSAEANVLAREFQNMSGPEVLQEMVRRMDEAGISSNQMSFALEGVASDTTDLIPLLKDGAKELNNLKNEFEGLGVTLSQDQIDKIKDVGVAFSKLGAEFSAGNNALIAEYSEELLTAVEALKVIGAASADLFAVIANGWGNIIELSRAALTDLVNGTDTFANTLEERTLLSQEKIDKLLGNNTKALEIIITGGTKAVKSATKEESASLDQRLKNFSNYTKAAAVVNAGFLEDNKAIKAGLIVADTAAAVMMQLSSGDPYTAFGRAALAAAMGAVQLSNALSSTKGGGSVSGGDSGGSSNTQEPQQDFQPETSSLQLSDSDSSGSQVTAVPFSTDSGDELMDVISKLLNERRAEGRN